ncbi:hypothetical protein Zmor_003116 [Zophobas morio]|uniref:Uncharacterized protein n=1 Tax=Zophobas morio TaxID=2755281 RepID=A0AA38HNB2_9CUCU|nr:hypothetical protein Zmor_003116 [Zophobas morio]
MHSPSKQLPNYVKRKLFRINMHPSIFPATKGENCKTTALDGEFAKGEQNNHQIHRNRSRKDSSPLFSHSPKSYKFQPRQRQKQVATMAYAMCIFTVMYSTDTANRGAGRDGLTPTPPNTVYY